MSKYTTDVKLRCPNCGNTSFETEKDVFGEVKKAECSQCNSEFTKQTLMDANQSLINSEAKKFGKAVVKDLLKDFKI